MLKRDDILGAGRELKKQEVKVPAWGGNVMVRELSASEQDAFEASFAEERQKAIDAGVPYKPNVRGKMLVACVCDDQGKQIFQAGDEKAIGDMPAHELEPVINVADQLNKFTKVHKEILEKKYAATGASASATGSASSGEKTLSS